ncbi:EamA family transporter [Sphaerisporangium sp. TRM90804]|uniref:DMT family transporter n=1 Tax=Sphaerisporangium sp. TRM90804 TaxID=3031113 RepID=UPI00244BF605|nr:EamA family transporter [Sphaerisporangium sp. TRM90804]MDH2429159.1 EamA family transporter [Sphaerisporangium sp. TRM90804]
MLRVGPLPSGRAVFLIAVAATAWGTGGAVAAVLYSASGLDSSAVSFWRFAGGALALGVAWPLLRGRGASSLVEQVRRAPMRLVATGAGMALYQTAYFAAVGSAGVAIATVVTLGSGPVLVALGSRLWLGERLGGRGVLVVASALAGLVLMVLGGGAATGPAAGRPGAGVALAVLSAVAYAATTLLTRSVMGRAPATPLTRGDRAQGGQDDPLGSALVGFVVGTLCLLPFALVSGLLPGRGDPATVVAMLAYLGLVPSALAYGLFFTGLRAVTATTASVVALVEPLAAAAIAVGFLGERLTVPGLLGAVVLLAAVLVLSAGRRGA